MYVRTFNTYVFMYVCMYVCKISSVTFWNNMDTVPYRTHKKNDTKVYAIMLSRSLLGRVPFGRIGAGCILTSMTAAWYYRPLPIKDEKQYAAPNRSAEFFCSDRLYPVREDTPFLLSMARGLSIGITTIAIRLVMNTYGSYELDTNDEHYVNFLETVLGSRRNPGQGMLTVSNHRSLFDDPGVVSCILPLWVGIRPKFNRWGICSQEYCFNDVLPGIIKGYIGAGQVLPICRGAGINQTLLLDFARLLASGEWCHIFPEGGAWQRMELGGRPAGNSRKGKLKWGVGKLIAHAPICPKVIPFAHVGMEAVLPQDRKTRKTYFKFIGPNELQIKIKFGPEIHFDDLIQEYELEHGKLWKYSSQTNVSHWESSDNEKELYRKITLRIENELEKVTKTTVETK